MEGKKSPILALDYEFFVIPSHSLMSSIEYYTIKVYERNGIIWVISVCVCNGLDDFKMLKFRALRGEVLEEEKMFSVCSSRAFLFHLGFLVTSSRN